jgi:hypothetical protein
MSTSHQPAEPIRARTQPLVAWALLAGGAIFFLGGALHPKDDPAGITLDEHLHVMYENDIWYPSHALILVGTVLMAAALVALVRGGALARDRTVHVAGAVAAVTASLGTVAAFLHLIMAIEVDRIGAGQSTPLTDVNSVVETIVAPAFGLSIAALAVVGARTGTIGTRVGAVLAVIGGVGFALAGGTFLLTDALDPLFPLAGLIGAWAAITGVSLLRTSRTPAESSLAMASR